MTQNRLLHYFPVLNSPVKKFLRIKHTVANKFAVSSPSMEPLLVSPTKPISRLSMTLIVNCTNNATSSNGFFSESRIIATSPLASTNWLFALRISFYLLLSLFTFNLPTDPSRLLTQKRLRLARLALRQVALATLGLYRPPSLCGSQKAFNRRRKAWRRKVKLKRS